MATPYSAEWYQDQINPDTAQSQASQLGVSTDQLYQLYANSAKGGTGTIIPINPQRQNPQMAPTWSGRQNFWPSDNTTAPIVDAYGQMAAFSQATGGLGGGKKQQQGPQFGAASQDNPLNAMTMLGAAALQMPGIVNWNPTMSEFNKKTGTQETGKPQITSGTPNAPTGPWSNMPGLFAQNQNQQATPAPAPIMPAVQATGTSYQPVQPFAQASVDQAVRDSLSRNAFASAQPGIPSGYRPPPPSIGQPPPAPGIASDLRAATGAPMPGTTPNVGSVGTGPSNAPGAGGVLGGIMPALAGMFGRGGGGMPVSLGQYSPAQAGSVGSMAELAGGYSGGGGQTVGQSMGGMDPSKMQQGLALIGQASHVGDSMQNIGSWQTQPSAIPNPDDFKQQQPQINLTKRSIL